MHVPPQAGAMAHSLVTPGRILQPSGMAQSQSNSPRPVPPPRSPTLSSACLIWSVDPACATEAISKQLIAHKASNNLRRLSQWWRDAMPSSSLFAFVRSLGPSLTHLEIGIMLSRWATDLMAEQGESVSRLRSPAGMTVRLPDARPAPQGNGEPSHSPTVQTCSTSV